MVVRFVRNCTAIVAVTAYVGLAVGGHALHDVTCDHHHPHHPAISVTTSSPAAGCEHHCHHHHGHLHNAAPADPTAAQTPREDHDHPPQPRHDHDCLICNFVAMNMAVVADAIELPEAPRDPATVVVVVPLETIYRSFGGNPRAPPA